MLLLLLRRLLSLTLLVVAGAFQFISVLLFCCLWFAIITVAGVAAIYAAACTLVAIDVVDTVAMWLPLFGFSLDIPVKRSVLSGLATEGEGSRKGDDTSRGVCTQFRERRDLGENPSNRKETPVNLRPLDFGRNS